MSRHEEDCPLFAAYGVLVSEQGASGPLHNVNNSCKVTESKLKIAFLVFAIFLSTIDSYMLIICRTMTIPIILSCSYCVFDYSSTEG